MDAQHDIGSVVEEALKAKFPDIKFSGERIGCETFVLDFTVGLDSGSISIDIEPEKLLCLQCSGVGTTDPANLVPVTDGETFGIACVHNLSNLRHWRELTADERADFDAGSADLFNAIEGLSRGPIEIDDPGQPLAPDVRFGSREEVTVTGPDGKMLADSEAQAFLKSIQSGVMYFPQK